MAPVLTAIARSWVSVVVVAYETDELVCVVLYWYTIRCAWGHVSHELLTIQEIVLAEQFIEVAIGIVARFVCIAITWAGKRRDWQFAIARSTEISFSKSLLPASVTSRASCGAGFDHFCTGRVVTLILLLFKAKVTLPVPMINCMPLAKEVCWHIFDSVVMCSALVGFADFIGSVPSSDINLKWWQISEFLIFPLTWSFILAAFTVVLFRAFLLVLLSDFPRLWACCRKDLESFCSSCFFFQFL